MAELVSGKKPCEQRRRSQLLNKLQGLLIKDGGRPDFRADLTQLGRKCMTNLEALIGLPEFQITAVEVSGRNLTFFVEHTGTPACPNCNSTSLRKKDTYHRRLRHESFGDRWCFLDIKAHKFRCLRVPPVFPAAVSRGIEEPASTEPFRRYIFQLHWGGIKRSRLGKREGIGHATVERYFEYFLGRKAAELEGASCPACSALTNTSSLTGTVLPPPSVIWPNTRCTTLCSAALRRRSKRI